MSASDARQMVMATLCSSPPESLETCLFIRYLMPRGSTTSPLKNPDVTVS